MKQTSDRRKPWNLMQQRRVGDNIGDHPVAQNDEDYNHLTERERKIFHMTVLGLSSSKIASRLLISPRTVETHRENIMKKLGIRNKAELICYAFRHGRVDVEAEEERMKS